MKKLLASAMAATMVLGATAATAFADILEGDQFTLTVNDTPVSELGLLPGEAEIKITVAENESDLDDMKLTLRTTEGKDLIKSSELDGTDVVITLNDYAGVSKADLEFEIVLKNKAGRTMAEQEFRGEVGYEPETANSTNPAITMDNGELEIDYSEGSVHVVELSDGSESAEQIYLSGPYFSFLVKAVEQDDLYLGFNSKANKDISTEYEDADLTFFNFPGRPEFDFTGEMTVILPDEEIEYYLYSINADGEISAVNADLNEDGDALVFKTRTLGSYVLSDQELDTTITVGDEQEEENESGSGSGTSGESGDKTNPGTGSVDFVGVASAAAILSLAAAGAVMLRRKH